MIGHVLSYNEEFHHTIIEGAIEGQRPPGKPRNSYISQLKNDAGIDTYAGLERLAEDRDKWRVKLKTL
jgi:hypothetical protein